MGDHPKRWLVSEQNENCKWRREKVKVLMVSDVLVSQLLNHSGLSFCVYKMEAFLVIVQVY